MPAKRKKAGSARQFSITIAFLDSLERVGRLHAALWYAERSRDAFGRGGEERPLLTRRIERLKRRLRRKASNSR